MGLHGLLQGQFYLFLLLWVWTGARRTSFNLLVSRISLCKCRILKNIWLHNYFSRKTIELLPKLHTRDDDLSFTLGHRSKGISFWEQSSQRIYTPRDACDLYLTIRTQRQNLVCLMKPTKINWEKTNRRCCPRNIKLRQRHGLGSLALHAENKKIITLETSRWKEVAKGEWIIYFNRSLISTG
jgi:hypothetical protein